jgi:hypothetical protein
MGDEEIKIEAIKRLRLKPGDVVVLKHPEPLSATTYDKVKGMFTRVLVGLDLPFDVKFMLLTEGMDIEVIEPTTVSEYNLDFDREWANRG